MLEAQKFCGNDDDDGVDVIDYDFVPSYKTQKRRFERMCSRIRTYLRHTFLSLSVLIYLN